MHIIRSVDDMSAYGTQLLCDGKHLGLVPTMGYLHEGHLSLLKLLENRCDIKAATIYVNPTQFAPNEDFSRYPRDEARDLELLESAGCDVVFCPENLYIDGYQTLIDVEKLSAPLCGFYRPGHFRGVATVVLKLFNITRCSIAVFGQKDYQQAQVIERMVTDLNVPVELIFGETLREPDGLAMSSRNKYLSQELRKQAAAINKGLAFAQELVSSGQKNTTVLKKEITRIILDRTDFTIQYVEIVDPKTLESIESVTGSARALVAAYLGSTRLIDNIELRI